ncbi:hypothetical protein VTK56DRAFT_6133 [Thermocarpiscus australiensis]
MDAESLRLAIELQLEDLQALENAAPKKKRQDAGSFRAALNAYRAELMALEQTASDRAMSASIARADRRLPSKLSGDRSARSSRASSFTTFASTLDETVDELQRLYTSSPGIDADGKDESSSSAASRPWPSTGRENTWTRACVACCEEFWTGNLLACPSCDHEYCRNCLQDLFRASLTDETLFPPRCCGEAIPLEECLRFLPSTLVEQFRAKKVEFETPNRTYCHQPNCASFIPPESISGDVATCVKCLTTTCTICKGPSHGGDDCPDDPATQALAELAAQQGWQKCNSCRTYIELDIGCNHMTCRCGAQFCYVCGLPWKTCPCEQWDESRLYTRANAIVDRDAGARPMAAAQRANLVERERHNLMENHECEHEIWRSRRGAHRCEECGDRLPNYIYECAECHILACSKVEDSRTQGLLDSAGDILM